MINSIVPNVTIPDLVILALSVLEDRMIKNIHILRFTNTGGYDVKKAEKISGKKNEYGG